MGQTFVCPFLFLHFGIMSDQSFKKAERLNSRKEIEAIVKHGRKTSAGFIQLYWLEYDAEKSAPVSILVSVPKKKFKKAVDRNLLKRRMREAYRKNKSFLVDHCRKSNKSLSLMFIYNSMNIESYADIESKIVVLLKGLFPSDENTP